MLSADSGSLRHTWLIDEYQSGGTGNSYTLKAYSGDMADISATAAYYTMATASEGGTATIFNFHMNWGWSGSYNGWYGVYSDWKTGPYGFSYSENKNMIVNIY